MEIVQTGWIQWKFLEERADQSLNGAGNIPSYSNALITSWIHWQVTILEVFTNHKGQESNKEVHFLMSNRVKVPI